jgi:predicted NAD/FAD-binding protein
LKIAVIGAGAGGIVAAHLLQKKHDVTVFEASSSLGGHAHHERLTVDGQTFDVDTAFLIFNDHTYKTFGFLLKDLGVADRAIPAEMSSCFSDPQKNFHYTLGAGLQPFLAQPSTLARPELYQSIIDLLKFRKRAVRDLDSGRDLTGISASEYLSNYSAAFRENLVWPLTSAIWSLADGQMQDYPIKTLLDYFDNHQLLRGKSERKWKTFRGSSGVYVNAFAAQFRGRISLDTRIAKIFPNLVTFADGLSENFDHIILATHADTSLKLLSQPSALQRELLGAWRYQDNPVVLHHDTRVLHEEQKMWGSWNMRRDENRYEISYYLNRLQSLPVKTPVILTLGDPKVDKVVKRFNYRHPIFEKASVATQSELSKMNDEHVSFCGSYFGHGFHEDAMASAATIARRFGCDF